MKVETAGGDFLVHKGNDFGGSGGNTVVVPASDISSAWKESGISAKTKMEFKNKYKKA